MQIPQTTPPSESLYRPALIVIWLCLFCYVGAEVSECSLIINFLGLPDIKDFDIHQAGKFLSFFWGGAMIGRFIGAYLLNFIHQATLLIITAIVNACLIILVIFSHHNGAMLSLLLLGLFNSVMFPILFSLGVGLFQHLPRKNAASGWLIMAIVGGAIIPVCQGLLADSVGLHASFIIELACYLFIALTAWCLRNHALRQI